LFLPLSCVVGVAVALFVERCSPGVGLVGTALFVPYVLSLVVVAIIWQFLVVDKTGIIPQILQVINLGNISWLGDPKYALITLVLISVWYQAGYQMLLLLGGLGDIPRECIDASRLDGANWFKRLWYMILPLLKPTSFF